MAEFSLPKNSKVGKGKHFPAAAGTKNVRTFDIYRWNPDDQANPRVDSFEVDMDACTLPSFAGSRSTRRRRTTSRSRPAARAGARLRPRRGGADA